jgi:hypothetical protein
MQKKWRRLKKNLLTSFLDLSPTSIRDLVIHSQVKLDYQPPKNLRFKLAQTKEELEQAYRLLYQGYVASGSMAPNNSGMRITPYHALPSTSVLIALLDDKVVATLSIFRVSQFGLPVSKVFDVSSFIEQGQRFAEISSLCVSDEFKTDQRTLLFGLLKYLYEYSTKFFGIDIKLIVIKPFRRHFYESLLHFQPLEKRIVENYAFSNGATVMSEFLNLNTAPEAYKRIYNHYPEHQNLYKYFIESKISNFEFPERVYSNISDPVMTPELLHYFFIEKEEVLQKLSELELTILKRTYKNPEFNYLFFEFSTRIKNVYFSRSHERHEVKCKAILVDKEESLSCIVKVYDASYDGIMVYSGKKIKLNTEYRINVNITTNIYSYLTVKAKWTNGLGYYGLEINGNDSTWNTFIDHLENIGSNKKSA